VKLSFRVLEVPFNTKGTFERGMDSKAELDAGGFKNCFLLYRRILINSTLNS